MDSTDAVIAVAAPRLVAGRWCYWGSLAVGIALNAVEVYWLIVAIRAMMLDGSCNSVLIGLWFGVPLVPFALILFIAGWLLARRNDRVAFMAGVFGLAMAIVAVPLWLALGRSLTMTLGLG